MYVYFYINFAIVFFALLYATITDIKNREVSNFVSLGLLVYGTIANLIFFFLTKGYLSSLYFLVFDAIVFLICYIFWRFGVFAGGDAKLFSGIAATIPFQIFSFVGPVNSGFPFVLSLFILSVLLMLPIVSFRLFYAYFKNNNVKKTVIKTVKQNYAKFLFNILYVVSLYFIFSFFAVPIWVFFLVSILLGFVPKKIKYPISVVLFLISLIVNTLQTIYVMISAVVVTILLAFLIQFFVLSKSGLLNYFILVEELKEGDLLAYPLIKDKNKKLTYLKYNSWKEFKTAVKKSFKDPKAISNFLQNRKNLYSRIVIYNNLAGGLSLEEVKKIKTHFVDKKIELKETTPLVPSIFLSYIFMICFGDIIWYLVTLIY